MQFGVKGVIFDLDGTLVDSRLNFAEMRRDMGLADGEPILEYLASLPDCAEKKAQLEIVEKHEWAGARRATLIDGVAGLLQTLQANSIPVAIFTRNSRAIAKYTLENCEIEYDRLVAREDARPKPDPQGIELIAEDWGLQQRKDRLLMVGDYLYDIQAGLNAGVRTVLYAPESVPDFADQADHLVRAMHEVESYL